MSSDSPPGYDGPSTPAGNTTVAVSDAMGYYKDYVCVPGTATVIQGMTMLQLAQAWDGKPVGYLAQGYCNPDNSIDTSSLQGMVLQGTSPNVTGIIYDTQGGVAGIVMIGRFAAEPGGQIMTYASNTMIGFDDNSAYGQGVPGTIFVGIRPALTRVALLGTVAHNDFLFINNDNGFRRQASQGDLIFGMDGVYISGVRRLPLPDSASPTLGAAYSTALPAGTVLGTDGVYVNGIRVMPPWDLGPPPLGPYGVAGGGRVGSFQGSAWCQPPSGGVNALTMARQQGSNVKVAAYGLTQAKDAVLLLMETGCIYWVKPSGGNGTRTPLGYAWFDFYNHVNYLPYQQVTTMFLGPYLLGAYGTSQPTVGYQGWSTAKGDWNPADATH